MEVILSNKTRKIKTYIVKYSMQERLALEAMRKRSGSKAVEQKKNDELRKLLFRNRSNNLG